MPYYCDIENDILPSDSRVWCSVNFEWLVGAYGIGLALSGSGLWAAKPCISRVIVTTIGIMSYFLLLRRRFDSDINFLFLEVTKYGQR